MRKLPLSEQFFTGHTIIFIDSTPCTIVQTSLSLPEYQIILTKNILLVECPENPQLGAGIPALKIIFSQRPDQPPPGRKHAKKSQ